MKFLPVSTQTMFDRVGCDDIAQLRTATGATEASFKDLYVPQLRTFGEWVQELPLEIEHFNQPLGAFRFGVTSAWLALRMCDQAIFVQGSSSERRTLDPQYRYAAFCACLASTLLLVQHHLVVEANEAPWSYLSANPNLMAFTKTLNGGYSVSWSKNAKRPTSVLSPLFLCSFFPPGGWEKISPSVYQDFCTAINPGCNMAPGETPLSKVVRQGMEKARELDVKGRSGQYSPSEMTAPVVSLSNDNLPSQQGVPEQRDPSTNTTTNSPLVAIQASQERAVDFSPELQAFAAHIRASKAIQEQLELEADGTLKFDANFLKNAGLPAQRVYEWMKNAGVIVEQRELPKKHLVLSAAFASILKVKA